MSIHTLPPKEPEERIPVTFDFTDEMPSTDSILTVAVTFEAVVEGVDAAPNLFDGAAQIAGRQVVQWLKAGVNAASYHFKAKATTSEGRVLVLRTVLPVIQETA